jgi:type 1 glutamine amidotransferase
MSKFTLLISLLLTALLLPPPATADQRADFNVLAFYSANWDAAHIAFARDANNWFPQQEGFTYTATTDWNRLTNLDPEQYQVILFLDDQPHSAAEYTGFRNYMEAGGGFFGFHVCAYNDDGSPSYGDWFHDDFLGTGRFATNTWGPTDETLKLEDHPVTANLPGTIRSSVSEWYSWEKDLRQDPDIQILASLDPSTFPVGDDPNQQWRDGYYPIVWTNTNYRMLYANFGHDRMNYETNTPLSSTFDSPDQNRLLLDGLRWLAAG